MKLTMNHLGRKKIHKRLLLNTKLGAGMQVVMLTVLPLSKPLRYGVKSATRGSDKETDKEYPRQSYGVRAVTLLKGDC